MMSGFNLLRMESSEQSNEPSGSTQHSTIQREWCHIPETVNPLLTVMESHSHSTVNVKAFLKTKQLLCFNIWENINQQSIL